MTNKGCEGLGKNFCLDNKERTVKASLYINKSTQWPGNLELATYQKGIININLPLYKDELHWILSYCGLGNLKARTHWSWKKTSSSLPFQGWVWKELNLSPKTGWIYSGLGDSTRMCLRPSQISGSHLSDSSLLSHPMHFSKKQYYFLQGRPQRVLRKVPPCANREGE